MGFIQEFKQFAIRGNVLDLAIAVIIGKAFSKIVTSLVQDIIMPPLGALIGGFDFTHFYIVISSQSFATLEAAEKAGVPLIRYGTFIQTVVDFTIIAFTIFIAIKLANRFNTNEEETSKQSPPKPSEDILLLREIRDSLKNK